MTQNEKILAALRDGKRISPLSALQDYGCMRLAARIYDLRDQGWDIPVRFNNQWQGHMDGI